MRKVGLIILILINLMGCSRKNDVIYINQKIEMPEMKIHYINIKNGRCTFLELPNGECMLVDCGASSDFPVVYEYLKNLHIKNIDYMIVSENDEYHLGGAIKIINSFSVHEMFVSKRIPNKSLYQNTAGEALRNNCRISNVESGTKILSQNKLNIYAETPDNNEDFSISLIISYGNVKCLLVANFSAKSQNNLATSSGDYLKSDILALPCSEDIHTAFLQKVSPKYAIIQTFNKKTPNKTTLDTMEILGVYALRTDVNGSIVITCNSEDIINIHTER